MNSFQALSSFVLNQSTVAQFIFLIKALQNRESIYQIMPLTQLSLTCNQEKLKIMVVAGINLIKLMKAKFELT